MKHVALAIIIGITICKSLNAVSLQKNKRVAIGNESYVLHVNSYPGKWKDTICYYSSKTHRCRYTRLPVTLTNNTADTLKYIDMSCSTLDIFTTSTVNARIFQELKNCFKNSEEVIKLSPHASLTFDVPLYFVTDTNTGNPLLNSTSFKIGMGIFHYHNKNSLLQDLSFSMVKYKDAIIWSNEISAM